MEYYGNNDWRDYHLAHYGVKGMKKGKHLPGTDWWKEGQLKGGILNIGGGKQVATNPKFKVAEAKKKKKKQKETIFENVGGPGRGDIGTGGKNKATAVSSSIQVKPNAVKLDPSAFDEKSKKTRKLKGSLTSTKKIKAVDSIFTKMGAKPGSLLRGVLANGRPQGTSMAKRRK